MRRLEDLRLNKLKEFCYCDIWAMLNSTKGRFSGLDGVLLSPSASCSAFVYEQ